jgi:leucyl aminopeptidase
MKINIKFLKQNLVKNLLIFCDENFVPKKLDLNFSKSTYSNILKGIEIEKKNVEKKEYLIFSINPTQKIFAFKTNKNSTSLDNEKLGGKFFEILSYYKINDLNIIDSNISYLQFKNKKFIFEFLHGFNLKSYEFNKYKTQNKNKLVNLIISPKFKSGFSANNLRYTSLAEGIKLTKDLVSEPGNILHPDEYAKRILSLKKLGLKVQVFDKKKLKKLGMNALLGVGQGSQKGSYLVTIQWNGSRKIDKPLAFVGKGVCFDTGGISLKPAKFMEDMTYDMAGSAVVVGLMKSLALRKAKVNAVGVVGLVENMPDGNAQRPGDIVKSYSGKTIEILNTDAEGRLVLADALTYTEKKYKPKFIVDLATLTGAIIVSLGSEYAGLFSNDDKISDQLSKAGEKVGEKVWRMPLNENYDKLINSKKADMQNINYVGGAGSATAAQFLQRFILNKTPWAHLDIAGMAFSKYGGALNSGGATGYGVRLLNQLIEDNYE